MKSGTLTSWNPLGHSRLVTELLYFYIPYYLFRMCVEVHHILLTMLTFVYSIYILSFYIFIIFYIHTVHLDTIKVFYSLTNVQVIVLKTILKFTLK